MDMVHKGEDLDYESTTITIYYGNGLGKEGTHGDLILMLWRWSLEEKSSLTKTTILCYGDGLCNERTHRDLILMLPNLGLKSCSF